MNVTEGQRSLDLQQLKSKVMKKYFVTKEKAIELHQLGFNEACLGCFYEDGQFAYHPDSDAVVDAPLYSQAFEWFRRVHKLFSHIDIGHDWEEIWYDYLIYKVELGLDYDSTISDEGLLTYEEAELECLKQLINIVKIKK